MTTTEKIAVTVRLIGGPTAVIEIGGLRLLTDPSVDSQRRIAIGNPTHTEAQPPTVPVDEIGPIHAVLLCHDQPVHSVDDGWRHLLLRAPLVMTTRRGAARLGDAARAMPPWYHLSLPRPDGGYLRITGVPAHRHATDGAAHVEVTGFVLSSPDTPTVYISGDNACLDVSRAVADRCGPIDIALLYAGAAGTALVDGYRTLIGDEAAQAAHIVDAGTVIPVCAEGWAYGTEGIRDLTAAFAQYGLIDRLRILTPGETATL
jgi:L-ascorbate metabolism protein UlaG (beta-lactamase superfamily)